MITTDVISQFSLFKGLSDSLLKEIAAISKEASAKKGEYIFREGEKADQLHFLVSGNIALRVKLTSKPEHVTVSFVGKPYESFGWSGVVPPYHYTSSAICEEDSQILVVSGEKFMQILEKHPEAGFIVMRRIAEIIADRLRNSRQALLKTL
jgi:CRP/FNR family cyclic AMP-dependent transcriptional regulator